MARFMRVIVFFFFFTMSSSDKKAYRHFRKLLIRNGFIMMQESVYVKLVLNKTAADVAIRQLIKDRPKKGLVQVLIVTEKQFSRMQYIVGDPDTDVVDDSERTIIL